MAASVPPGSIPTPQNESSSHEERGDIDPDGDVLLVVGTQPISNFRVSSKIISTASAVFRAMFSVQFKEGSALSQRTHGQACEVPLPDDDPASMEILMRILHFQNEALPKPDGLGATGFKQFVMVCDKYDCVEAVSFVSNAWLHDLMLQTVSREDTWILVQAVSFLDIPAAFRKLTRTLVLETTENFTDQSLSDDSYTFHALELHVALERQRDALRHLIAKDLMDPILPLIAKENFDTTPVTNNTVNHGRYFAFCLHDALQVSTYLRELRRLKLWPLDFQQTSLAGVLEKLYRYEEREIGPSMGFRMHGRNNDCAACTFDPRNKLQSLIDRVNSDAGLCLDCLRRGSAAPLPGSAECRIKHA